MKEFAVCTHALQFKVGHEQHKTITPPKVGEIYEVLDVATDPETGREYLFLGGFPYNTAFNATAFRPVNITAGYALAEQIERLYQLKEI